MPVRPHKLKNQSFRRMWHEGMAILLFSFIQSVRGGHRLLCIVVKLTSSVLTCYWLGPSLGTRHNSIPKKWKIVHICFSKNFSSDLQPPINVNVNKYIHFVSSEYWGLSLSFEHVFVYKSWGGIKLVF